MKPRFVHDCEKCKFLGTVDGRYAGIPWNTFDLYVCVLRDTRFTSFIARYGDRGDQYLSAPQCVIDTYLTASDERIRQTPVMQAYWRAMETNATICKHGQPISHECFECDRKL